MSGRLVILPKKSYCPWKPENVQRVLRDEAQHERQVAQHERQAESRARREALVHHALESNLLQRQSPHRKDDDYSPRHINLFEAEEQADEHASLLLLQRDQGRHQRPWISDQSNERSASIQSDYGTTRRIARSAPHPSQQPFYLRDNPYSGTAPSPGHAREALEARERQRKASLDPMAQYSVILSSDVGTSPKASSSTALVVIPSDTLTRKRRTETQSSSTSCSSDASLRDRRKRRRNERKRVKRRGRSKRKERSHRHRTDGDASDNADYNLDELRQRRRTRESSERRRAAELLLTQTPRSSSPHSDRRSGPDRGCQGEQS